MNNARCEQIPVPEETPAFMLRRFLSLALLVLTLTALSAGRAEAREALASWYGPGFEGQPTASGELFDKTDFTCAHKTLPLGSVLDVSYNGRSTQCRVNDRGPYVGDRELDLSEAAADYLGLTGAGVDIVDYDISTGAPDSVAGDGYPASPTPKNTATEYGDSTGYEDSAGVAAGNYYVEPGDTLREVSAQLGTSTWSLASLNSIEDPDVLPAGTALYTTPDDNQTSEQPATPPGGYTAATATKGSADLETTATGATSTAAVSEENASGGEFSGSGNAVVNEALAYLGVPYVSGGNSGAGLDCSAFTDLIYESFGISLPDSPALQYGYGAPVSGEPAAGDLVFWSANGGASITHVGIAVSDGNVVHASKYSMRVTVSPMANIPGYAGARRLM